MSASNPHRPCDNFDDSTRVANFNRAIAQEGRVLVEAAKPLAKTMEQMQLIESLIVRVEEIDLGPAVAEKHRAVRARARQMRMGATVSAYGFDRVCFRMAAQEGFIPLRDRVRAAGLAFTVDEPKQQVCVAPKDKESTLGIVNDVGRQFFFAD